jgi:predicted DNA-binding transcriptional regulator
MYDLEAFANETDAGRLTVRDVTKTSYQKALVRLRAGWVEYVEFSLSAMPPT